MHNFWEVIQFVTDNSLVMRERDHWENLGIDGRIVLKLIFNKYDGVGGEVDWKDVAQDRDKQWAVVNIVMNL